MGPICRRERERERVGELASWASAQEEKKGAQGLGPAGRKEKGEKGRKIFLFQTKFPNIFSN